MKVFVAFIILLFSACSVFDNEQSISDADVVASANDPIFSVLNKSEFPVVYIVIETETSHLVDLDDPCRNFQPNLLPRKNTQFNYSEIMGWTEDAESVWFFWTNCESMSDSKTIKL